MADSVATLVQRARSARASLQHRQAAFAELVHRFERAAFSIAVDLTGDADVARDVCQDAFLDAWRLLGTVREPAAFAGWLRRLVHTHAARWRRKQQATVSSDESIAVVADGSDAADPAHVAVRKETLRLIWSAVNALSPSQREVVILFYFLGEPMRAIAAATRTPIGTVGKRLHSARLALRRELPRSIASGFLAAAPTAAFAQQVLTGVFAEFEGEYRFAARPDHPVLIRREGGLLVALAGGQRTVMASSEPDVLRSTVFDGDARFERDARGRITHFVYYEFGKRLGVARKQRARATHS